MSTRFDKVRELIAELSDAYVDGGREAARPFVEGMAHDLDQLWTVPVERQDAFLERMGKQALALPELGRLSLVGIGRHQFVAAITIALRFATRILIP